MPTRRQLLCWGLGLGVASVVLVPPVLLYRAQYIHAKRFREVDPGKLYRSGQMTADGFRETVERYHIKTVVNLQHEEPDPLLPDHWLGKGKIRESELCQQLDVNYKLLTPDLLPPGNTLEMEPPAVKEWLGTAGRREQRPDPAALQGGAASHRAAHRDLPHGVSPLVGWGGAPRTPRQRLWLRHVQRSRRVRDSVYPELQAAGEGGAAVITTLDRMFLFSYFRSYAIVWTSLIGLYVVLDLFTHLDDFASKTGGFGAMAGHIIGYYGYRIPQLFDLMAEPITLMAAAFSVSWMQRNNELLPQLSAGIPTRRAIRPILLGAAVTLSLSPLNQEFLIPAVADQLMTKPDDPEGAKAQVLTGAYDTPTGTHLEGYVGFRKDKKVERMNVTFPENSPSGMIHVAARRKACTFRKATARSPAGGCSPASKTRISSKGDRSPRTSRRLGTGRFFLKVTDADYEAVCRGSTWYIYAPTTKLREMLIDPEPRRRGKMAVLFHSRLTRPLVGAIMVVLGLSVILWTPTGTSLSVPGCVWVSRLG